MTQKTIKIFIGENYSKPPKNTYPTEKTDVYHTDDIWSSDIVELKDYGPENIGGYRFNLVIVDNFSNFGWTIPLKDKNAQAITNTFETNLISSKRKPNLIGTDRGKQFLTVSFKKF